MINSDSWGIADLDAGSCVYASGFWSGLVAMAPDGSATAMLEFNHRLWVAEADNLTIAQRFDLGELERDPAEPLLFSPDSAYVVMTTSSYVVVVSVRRRVAWVLYLRRDGTIERTPERASLPIDTEQHKVHRVPLGEFKPIQGPQPD